MSSAVGAKATVAKMEECVCARTPRQIRREMMQAVRFMRQDPDNLVFRNFGKLQLYNLLFLQHELSHISEEVTRCEDSGDAVDKDRLNELLPRLNSLLKTYREHTDCW